MRIVSSHLGLLRTVTMQEEMRPHAKSFVTGLTALDSLPPRGAFAYGAIHEILADPSHGEPRFFALLLARAAAAVNRNIIWSDPRRELYPPALVAAGLSLDRLHLLHPRNPRDEVWAIAECLGCRGISAMIAAPPRLSRVEARRLQLAAERGGGAGILMRSTGAASTHYAAATRWLIQPAPGSATVQRWSIQLIHGHGGLVGKNITLEVCRDSNQQPNHVRAIETMASGPIQTQTARVSA